MVSGPELDTAPPAGGSGRFRLAGRGRAIATHLAVLLGYLGAGIAVSWPRASYLTDQLAPGTRDAALFVWDLWWMARSVEHLSNPWFTRFQAAPMGTQLGYHTLMPLPGWLMAPVTLGFGPSVSYNLLSVAAPALMSYAMYRVARLWVRSQTGAIAAGAFFGLSTILTWNAWYELNIALGAIFLPLTLEATVRLTRRPGWPRAVILGVVLGAALLTDQESAIMAGMLAIAALLPWLARRRSRGGAGTWVKLRVTALAAVVSGAVASPQIVAMLQQSLAGNAATSPELLAGNYIQYAAAPKQIFAPSPRVAAFGLHGLAGYYYHSGQETLPIDAYGLVLLFLALCGLAVCWRRRAAWLLALFWLICTIGALGTGILAGGHEYVPDAQWWDGIRVSLIMPYSWLIRLSLFSSFREANRLLELGLVPLALLAAAAVDWVRRHAWSAVAAVAILASFETGVAGAVSGPVVTMSTALSTLARPIAADHTGSIVVDIPYGVRSGAPMPGTGAPFAPQAQILATEDGHPSAVGYVSRLPESTLTAVGQQPFYADLLLVQEEPRTMTAELLTVHRRSLRRLAALKLDVLRLDAHRLGLGWAVIWLGALGGDTPVKLPAIEHYLEAVGFRFAYQADDALVFRMKSVTSRPTVTAEHALAHELGGDQLGDLGRV